MTSGGWRMRAALVTSLVGAAALVATPASARPRPVSIAIESTFKDDGFVTHPDGLVCPGNDPQACELQFHGSSTTTGNLHGSETYRLWFYQGADESPASRTYETFTGTIEGCGTGTLDFTVKNVQPAPHPVNAPAVVHFDGDWEIVAGSGTAGLAGVSSGAGQEHGDMVLPTTANTGQFVGTIMCRPAG